MRNKLAWPYNPSDVASDLTSRAASSTGVWEAHGLRNAAKAIARGQRYQRVGGALGRVGWGAAKGVGGLANSVLSPLGNAGAWGLSRAGNFLANHPGVTTTLGTAVLAAPFVLGGASTAYNRATDNILQARQDPGAVVDDPHREYMGRTVMASLDSFLEKKAAFDWKGYARDQGFSAADSAVSGLASGVGSALAKSVLGGVGSAASGIHNALVVNPRKKEIFGHVMQNDEIVSDAVQRNPAMNEHLLDAYSTLNKFAPTLATDRNAVRSFMREVVLGGGQVNYATIKNLVDTERAIQGAAGGNGR